MTFDELTKKPNKTEAEQILIQCVATLSTKDGYTNMTPWEVFESQQKWAAEVGY